MRVLELFCGIGGCAAALPAGWSVAAAVDVNRSALAVYAANFPGHRVEARTLDAVDPGELARHGADLWWLSPPCQPHTTRGLRRDLDDPRSAALVRLVECLERVRPPAFALENVPGFAGSRAHALVRGALERAGYEVRERTLCPSELGLPNRRRRFFLAAGRAGCEPRGIGGGEPAPLRRPLAAFLDRDPAPGLAVDPGLARRYRHALDVVDPADPEAVTACFTAAYGRSPVRSGSYLRLSGGSGASVAEDEERKERGRFGFGTGIGTGGWVGLGGERRPEGGRAEGERPEGERPRRNGDAEEGALRRFSPTEILRLLDFPAGFRLPPDLPPERAWPLVGNSLAVAAVRRVLGAFPG